MTMTMTMTMTITITITITHDVMMTMTMMVLISDAAGHADDRAAAVGHWQGPGVVGVRRRRLRRAAPGAAVSDLLITFVSLPFLCPRLPVPSR